VCEKLRVGWSPQQIAGRLRKEINEGVRPKGDYINHESIYQYVYDSAQKENRLWEYLPRGHRKRRRWLGRKSKRPTRISQRVSIYERGSAIDKRSEFGHWEGDTIVGDKCLAYSNGQTEGQVGRLKFIKRSGYGRAKLDLLRQRVLVT
jgi:IS30 family transposase